MKTSGWKLKVKVRFLSLVGESLLFSRRLTFVSHLLLTRIMKVQDIVFPSDVTFMIPRDSTYFSLSFLFLPFCFLFIFIFLFLFHLRPPIPASNFHLVLLVSFCWTREVRLKARMGEGRKMKRKRQRQDSKSLA